MAMTVVMFQQFVQSRIIQLESHKPRKAQRHQ